MDIGICSGIENAAKLKQAGADFVEVNVQNFLKPRDDEDAFAPHVEAAKASPLPIRAANGFLPGDLPSTGPDVDAGAIAAYADTAFQRARRLGIESIVFGSGGSRQLKEGWSVEQAMDQFVELLKRLGPIAETNGVTMVVEPLRRAECDFINTLAEGAEAVERTDHPHVRLLADFYHMFNNDERPNDVATFAGLIHHVHIAEKANRTPCGVDGDNFRPFLAPLREAGYAGRISFECKWPEGGPEAHAAEAIVELRKQLDDVGY